MKRLKKHVYKFGEVVIGSGLGAAIYAHSNNSVLVDCGANTPCEFVNIGKFDKHKLCQDLRFQMSVAGRLPFSDKVESIRVSDSMLKISTKNYRLIKANFDNLVIFDDTSLYGLNPPFKKNFGKYVVLDWFDVRSGVRHDNNRLSSDSEFVSEVRFYNSRRIGTKKDDKDLVATSYLTKEQLGDIDYSDLYVKFKTLEMMKKAGIQGARNGTATPRCPLKIELSRREIKKYFIDFYENYDNIRFEYRTDEEVFESSQPSPSAYVNKFNGYI